MLEFHTLSVSRCGFSGEGCEYLCSSIGESSTFRGLIANGQLEYYYPLLHLELTFCIQSDNPIGDQGIRAILEMLKHNKVTTLEFRGTYIEQYLRAVL